MVLLLLLLCVCACFEERKEERETKGENTALGLKRPEGAVATERENKKAESKRRRPSTTNIIFLLLFSSTFVTCRISILLFFLDTFLRLSYLLRLMSTQGHDTKQKHKV
jgi:hypothetical protein